MTTPSKEQLTFRLTAEQTNELQRLRDRLPCVSNGDLYRHLFSTGLAKVMAELPAQRTGTDS